MFEESSKKHGIWKSHLTTLRHAHHSVDDVVGEVEGFSDGETIKHVAKRHVWMTFITGETNDIFIKNEVPFVESILEFSVNHLEWMGIKVRMRIKASLKGRDRPLVRVQTYTLTRDSKDLSKILKIENGFDILNSKPHANGSVKVSNETEAPIELKDEDRTNLLVNVE
ncbi:hypothetical protein Tco_1136766 [Tanacetum coccineum]